MKNICNDSCENMTRFRRNLRKIERAVSNSLKSEGRCCGITFNECHILLELNDCGAVNTNELASRLGIDKSIVSKTIETLHKQKLITRKEDVSDRRKKTITLSQAGNKKVTFINKIMNNQYKTRLENFNEEQITLFLNSIEYVAETFEEWNKSFSEINFKGEHNGCGCN